MSSEDIAAVVQAEAMGIKPESAETHTARLTRLTARVRALEQVVKLLIKWHRKADETHAREMKLHRRELGLKEDA